MSVLQLHSLIQQGAGRNCFRHPEDATKCVKVMREQGEAGVRTPTWNANQLEHDLWQKHISDNDALRPFFPAIYGLEMTDHGQGLVCELIRNSDGQISQHLPEFLETADPSQKEELRGQLRRIKSEIIRCRILIVDWTAQNFLVEQRGDDITLKIVDFQSRPNEARFFKRLKAARKAKRVLPVI